MSWLTLTAVTSADVAKIPWDGKALSPHSKPKGGHYTKPSCINPWGVPPPPDYSTPAAVTARAWEAGSHSWPKKYTEDRTVARAYRAFRAATGAWVDPTPLMPHHPKVGRKWTPAKLAAARAKLAKERAGQ